MKSNYYCAYTTADILIPSRRALRISFQLADADVPDRRCLDMDDLSEATS